MPDSIVYSDSWRGYNALDVSSFKHFRINHSVLFADAHNHINGIENFWNQVKRHMRKGSCLAELSQERHKALYGNEKPILEKFETF